MILPRIESTSQLCLIRSPYRTSTSESTGHTVTGMEKHLDAKITHTANQLARKCRKKKYDSIHDRFIRDKTFRKAMIEVGRSETIILEMDQLASEDHTYKSPPEQKLTYTVAIGGFTQTWQTSIRCQQGINLISRRRCRQCTASSKRRTRINMQNGQKVPPLRLGNGKQTGGSLILSTHLKDGMTTDSTGQPVT